MVELVVVDNVKCPKCGAEEVENPNSPVSEWVFNIRAFRVCDKDGRWWSQCMKCKDDPQTKGWFV